MRVSAPCTWEDALLEGIGQANRDGAEHPITELYGSLSSSIIGSGHSAASIRGRCLKRRDVEQFVRKVHASGLRFNYTVNSSCFGNLESDRNGQKRIRAELEWLLSFSDAVTVTVPFLMEMIREMAGGRVEIVASVIAGIDTVQKINHFRTLGVDRVVLDMSLNRDLARLKEIRKHTAVELEMLANDSCLFECPFRSYHYNMGSHASRRGSLFYLDYCVYKCTLLRMEHPEEILKSRWVRPEDLVRYGGVVDVLKVAGREKSSDWVVNAAGAYSRGVCEGNVLDLLTIVSPDSHELGRLFFGKSPSFTIQREALDTYMDAFLVRGRTCLDCASCQFCRNFAARHLTHDEEERRVYAARLRRFGQKLFSLREGTGVFGFAVMRFLFLNYVRNTWMWRRLSSPLKWLTARFME